MIQRGDGLRRGGVKARNTTEDSVWREARTAAGRQAAAERRGFKAHRPLCLSTLGVRVIKKKKKRVKTLKRFKDFDLTSKARIWP